MPVFSSLVLGGVIVSSASNLDGLPNTVLDSSVQQARGSFRLKGKAIDGSEDINISYQNYQSTGGKTVFTGAVVLRYDVTVLKAEQVTYDESTGALTTEGKTGIEDPEAEISCLDLALNTRTHSSTARELKLKVAGVSITAATVDFRATKWILHDVEGTTSRFKTPAYKIRAHDIVLTPGESGVAKSIFVEFGSLHFGPIPQYDFNLDRRVTGFKLPDVAVQRGLGLGLSWYNSVLLNDHIAALAAIDSFPNTLPTTAFMVARSSLDPAAPGQPIIPRSDIDEYVADGFMDNLYVRSIADERGLLTGKRETWGIGTLFNDGTTGRLIDSTNVSKILDIAAEEGGSLGAFGFQSSLRLQRIRDDVSNPWVDRLNFRETLSPKPLQLGSHLALTSRLDGSETFSQNGTFGFVRGESALVYEPIKGLDFGFGGAYGKNFGRPDFGFDPLPFEQSLLLRADYRRGFLTLRYLNKYDLQSHRWYDREYELAVVADGFEPFILSRSFPSVFQVGVRFRLDEFASKLLDRQIKRAGPKKD